MKIIHIQKNDTMDDVDIKFLTLKNVYSKINKLSKYQGEGLVKELYYWNYDNYKICCYGWYDGESGFENKHDLPPGGSSSFLEEDSSEKLLFGDLFLLKIKDDKLFDLDIPEYSEFYNIHFSNFEDCESENDSIISEDEKGEDDLLNDEDIDEDYEIVDNSDNELENDNYDY